MNKFYLKEFLSNKMAQAYKSEFEDDLHHPHHPITPLFMYKSHERAHFPALALKTVGLSRWIMLHKEYNK